MDKEWQKLGRPAVLGFLFGLVVMAAVAYAVPAMGSGTATAVERR